MILADRLGPTRILAFGGVFLLLSGMLVGEVYAIFVSHVKAHDILLAWENLLHSVQETRPEAVQSHFDRIIAMLEQRGRILRTHSESIALGYLAITLALVQPLLGMGRRVRQFAAVTIIVGAVLTSTFTFIGYYTGPWADVLTDGGVVLILLGLVTMVSGLLRSGDRSLSDFRRQVGDIFTVRASRILLLGGLTVIVLGMAFGLYYAWAFVYHYEPERMRLIERTFSLLSGGMFEKATETISEYRTVTVVTAIRATVHSHAIDFGTMALLTAFLQPMVLLANRWKTFWASLMVVSAFLMPVCIYTATHVGLAAAALADVFGGLIMLSLSAMAFGLIRYTGAVDHSRGVVTREGVSDDD